MYVLKASEDQRPTSWICSWGRPACASADAPPERIEWPNLDLLKNWWNRRRNQDRVGSDPLLVMNKKGEEMNSLSRMASYLRRVVTGHAPWM